MALPDQVKTGIPQFFSEYLTFYLTEKVVSKLGKYTYVSNLFFF